jgi:two-component system OmpR family response regulator
VHVLLSEPDPRIAAFARRALRDHGARVTVTPSAAATIAALRGERYDGVVLAVALADGSGYETCRLLREAGVWTTVLLLLDRTDTTDRARESGADGYLRKPFSGSQLLTALGDLEHGRPATPAAGLRIDPASQAVVKRGVEVRLSPIEFALMELLARHAGDVVDRTRLLEHAWNYEYENASNVVEVYLRRLREKVDRPFGSESIETFRGRGYRLRDSDG